VFITIAAASIASPIRLVSPENGSTLCPGAVIDFELTDANVASVTWDNGSGPRPLSHPFDISTAGWPAGPYTLTLNATAASGPPHSATFTFFLSSARPPCP